MIDELKQWEYDKGYTKGYSDGRASMINELEKVKLEIQNLFTTSICGGTSYYNAIQVDDILNKHITELKGSD